MENKYALKHYNSWKDSHTSGPSYFSFSSKNPGKFKMNLLNNFFSTSHAK